MLNEIIDTIRLDVAKSAVNVCLYTRLADQRTYEFILVNNGKTIDLSKAVITAIIIKKSDGNQTYQSMTRDGNKLRYTLHDQDVSTIGECECMLQVGFADGTQITSPAFTMIVEDLPLDVANVTSASEYSALSKWAAVAETKAGEAGESAEIAMNSLKTAEQALEEIKEILANSEILIQLLEGMQKVTEEDIDAMWSGSYVPESEEEE